MKYFKCGKCQTPYKIDESKIRTVQASVKCIKCGAANLLRMGPVLTAMSKDMFSQFSLNPGMNTIGRVSSKKKSMHPITDPYVSRVHACIHVEDRDGKIFISIEDLESMNGIYNKDKIKLKKKLKYPFTKDDYFIMGLTKLTINY